MQSYGRHCWQRYRPTTSLTHFITTTTTTETFTIAIVLTLSPPALLTPSSSSLPAKRTRKAAKHQCEAELLQDEEGDRVTTFPPLLHVLAVTASVPITLATFTAIAVIDINTFADTVGLG
jgi:hypothetical protein